MQNTVKTLQTIIDSEYLLLETMNVECMHCQKMYLISMIFVVVTNS